MIQLNREQEWEQHGYSNNKLEKEFLHNLDRTGNIPVFKFCSSICDCVVSDRPYRFCHGTDGGYDDGVSPTGGFRTVYRRLYRPV